MLNLTLKNSAIKQALYMLIVFWIHVLFGICRSYLSLLFYQLDLPDSKLHLSDDEKTWMVTYTSLLSPLTSIPCGFLMDAIGRKKCTQFLYIPFLIAWLIMSSSSNYTLLVVAMITESIGLGMGVCAITYVAEIFSIKVRQSLIAILTICFNIGAISCNVLMYLLRWNTVSSIFGIITAIIFILTFTLPESPLWLYSQGKKEQAIQVLCHIRCKEAHEIENEIIDLEKAYLAKSKKTGCMQTVKNCLRGWKQFSIASTFYVLLSLAGSFVIIPYNVVILNHLKMSYDSAFITVLYSLASFAGSFLTPYVTLKCKRRANLIISAGGMTLCMLAIGVYEELFYFYNKKPYSLIIPIAMCGYGLLSSIGVFSIGMVIGGDLFPPEARGALQGIYGFFMFICVILLSKFYPLVLFHFGIKTLIWSFFTFSLGTVLFTVFILPETSGKTLMEIQEQYFSKKKKNVTDLRI